MKEDNTALVRRFWQGVFNEGQLELIPELFTDDYRLTDLATDQTHTRDEYKEAVARIRLNLPDARAGIVWQLETVDGAVVSLIRCTATFVVPSTDAVEVEVTEAFIERGEDSESALTSVSEEIVGELSEQEIAAHVMSVSRFADGRISESVVLRERAPEVPIQFFYGTPIWPPEVPMRFFFGWPFWPPWGP